VRSSSEVKRSIAFDNLEGDEEEEEEKEEEEADQKRR
jgi:hypothetical protein